MKTIMITAPASNSGKTTITLGLIRALKNRSIDVRGFKTGPDFIDTKLLSISSKKKSGNLDMHMMSESGLKESLSMNIGEVGIVEGAMGYFDGIFNTYENSSFDISRKLDIPAVLVYSPKGEMFSVIPKIKGMVEFKDSKIKAVILNKVSPSIYILLKEQIEKYVGIKVIGYVPKDETLKLESNSLGLSISEDSEGLDMFLENAALKIEETVDIDSLVELAQDIKITPFSYPKKKKIKVAIAYDKAFNFYYQENLNLLENICNVEYFSPLEDSIIPTADLIYIGGGYPENYRYELSENKSMMDNLKTLAQNGSYILAESGGMMYLESVLEETQMVNIFNGKAKLTEKLQRFGYVNIELLEDTILGEKASTITAKEFHKSFIETDEKEIFSITKPKSNRSWKCGYKFKNTLAYYQHINFLGNKDAFENLIDTLEKIGVIKMYIKNPMEIENKSMDIIDEVMGDVNFSDEEAIVVKRMIHTTGDFEYRKIIDFKEDFIQEALEAIRAGATIFTDTRMAYMGINKPALEKANCELKCFIDDERVFKLSKELKTTRSSCAVDLAVEEGAEIFVIGNAPTALFRLLELVDMGKVNPKLIIGVPVGFVGACESKEALREYKIPQISTVGNKGGSNVAASIVNALLYMVVGR